MKGLSLCVCVCLRVCEKKDKTEKEVRPGENSFLKKADPKSLWKKQTRFLLPFCSCGSLCFSCVMYKRFFSHIASWFRFNSSVTQNAGCKYQCLHMVWDATAAASISARLFAVDIISSLCKNDPLAIHVTRRVKPRPPSSFHCSNKSFSSSETLMSN